jgi:SAM-dependent methyltransferase
MSLQAKCIWCSGTDFAPVFQNLNYQFMIRLSKKESHWYNNPMMVGCCLQCGTVSQLCMPSEKILNLIYSEFYSSYPSETIPEESADRSNKFLNALPASFFKGKALEIGSYNGRFLNMLQRKGVEVVGCDPNVYAGKAAKNEFGIETVPKYFALGIFESNSIDLVVFRLVLEHIMDPFSFFVGINHALKEGGHVALEVPNCQDLMENGSVFWMVEHITYFTTRSLERILNAAGFGEIYIDTRTNGFLWVTATKKVTIDKFNILRNSSTDADIALAESFSKRFAKTVEDIESHLAMARQMNSRFGIFGIGYFMANLIGVTSLEPAEIVGLFDNNSAKWGIRMAGFQTAVSSPAQIENTQINLMLIATQNWKMIADQLAPFMAKGGEILVFFPEPRLISQKVVKT